SAARKRRAGPLPVPARSRDSVEIGHVAEERLDNAPARANFISLPYYKDAMISNPDSLGFLLFDVARLMRRRYDRCLERAGLGIRAGEARTLAHIERSPGLRQTALAELMGVEPMTLVGILDRLEQAGYVARRPDPADRRAKLVHPTDEAMPVLARIAEVGALVRDGATEQAADADVEAARRTLLAMRRALSEPFLEEVR